MSETTINKSILNKNNFKLLIDKVPTVEYYVQQVNIPAISFNEVIEPSGLGVDAYFAGDRVSFETLNVTFLVDEDLQNFKEIYDWMSQIVPLSNTDDYGKLTGSKKHTLGVANQSGDALNLHSQITLVTNTNKNLPNRYFRFYDAFPISLSGIELQSGSETEPVTCEVQFRFQYYDIKSSS